MLDLRAIRRDPAPVRAALARRRDGSDERLDRVLELDERWRALRTELEALQAQRNAASKAIGQAKKAGEDASEAIAAMQELSPRVKAREDEVTAVEAELQQLLAGKVAGQPISCLPHSRTHSSVVVDGNTIVFRGTGNRVYVNNLLGGGCSNIRSGGYSLVTRTSGPALCRGEIAQVADLHTGTTVGSCVLGDFVPYTAPGRG